jgi:hypothetical protein
MMGMFSGLSASDILTLLRKGVNELDEELWKEKMAQEEQLAEKAEKNEEEEIEAEEEEEN